MKTFKHPKLGWIAEHKGNGSYSCKEIGCGDDYKKENDLIALGFEEVKDNHFGNGMVEPKYDICYIIATEYQYGHDNRVEEITTNKNCWSLFQTKEQAKQFDKMMMTVWKIWKWKKENDDTEGGEYSLYYNRQKKKFGWADYSIEYKYGFFLPRFSSSNDVHRLISDLGEELNNLLCWIK